MKKWNLIPRFLSLTLLLAACFLALKDGMNISWWREMDFILICLGVSAFATAAYYNRRTAVVGIVLGTLVEAGMILFGYDRLYQDWLRCYHHVIPLINQYYRTAYAYESVDVGDGRILLLFMAILLGLWIGHGAAYGKRRLLTLLPVAASFLAGLLLGYAPSLRAWLCLLGGLGLRLLIQKPGEEKAEKRSRQLVFLCLCLAVGVTALTYRPVSQKAIAYHDTLQFWQLAQEDKMLAWLDENDTLFNFFWDMGGNAKRARLSNQPPELTDTVMLTITADEPPIAPMYIKNFTGAYYDKGSWYPPSQEEFAAFADTQNREMQEYGKQIQEMAYEQYKSNVSTMNLTIEVLRKAGSLSPLPYGTSLPKGAEIVGDSGMRMQSDTYEVEYMPYNNLLMDRYGSFSVSATSGGMVEIKNLEQYTAYRSYVKEAYTKFPEGQLERLLLNPKMAIENLNASRYSFDLEPVPEGEDIIEYFLFEQKKGYCMHFASAFTLLARSMGIPARYASGYLVLPKDFTENADGTYTASVKEEQAHAWGEILSPSGWAVMETTPSSYYQSLAQREPQESVENIVDRLSREENTTEPLPPPRSEEPEEQEDLPKQEAEQRTEKESPNAANKEESQNTEEGSSGASQNSFFAGLWEMLSWILVPVFLLFILVCVLLLRVKLIWRFKEKRFHDSNDRRAVDAILKETFRLLGFLGIPFTGTEDEGAYAREAETKAGCFSQGEFMEFIEIARISRYSKKTLTQGQLQYLFMIYQRIKRHGEAQMKWYQRFYYRYILVWI